MGEPSLIDDLLDAIALAAKHSDLWQPEDYARLRVVSERAFKAKGAEGGAVNTETPHIASEGSDTSPTAQGLASLPSSARGTGETEGGCTVWIQHPGDAFSRDMRAVWEGVTASGMRYRRCTEHPPYAALLRATNGGRTVG